MNNNQEVDTFAVTHITLNNFHISRLLKTKKGVDYRMIIDRSQSKEFEEQEKYHCFEGSIPHDL
jgi:hypothetical protein